MASTSLASAPLSSLWREQMLMQLQHAVFLHYLHVKTTFYTHSRQAFQNLKVRVVPRDKGLAFADTYGLTCVKATEVHVFLCTSRPSLALPLTIQYGTPILRQRAGKNTTSWSRTSEKWQYVTNIHISGCKVQSIFRTDGRCSGLKSSYVWIHTEDSGEEIQTSLPATAARQKPDTNLTSIGSTSWAMTTSWAFLLSTRVVTVFTPGNKRESWHLPVPWKQTVHSFTMDNGQCSGLKSSKTIIESFRWRNSEHHCITAKTSKLIFLWTIWHIFSEFYLHGEQEASWWACLLSQQPSVQHEPAASASSPAWSLAGTCVPTWRAEWLKINFTLQVWPTY